MKLWDMRKMIREQGKESDKVVILRLMNLIGGPSYANRTSLFASYASISRLYGAL